MKKYKWEQYMAMLRLINSKIEELIEFSITKERCFKESTIRLFIKKLTKLCSSEFKISKHKINGLIRTQLKKEFYPKYILLYVNNQKVYYLKKDKNFVVAVINGEIHEVII